MRRLRELRADDRGTTLMELVVGMALLAIFMGMFTGAMLLMSNTVSKVEAVTASSAQVNNAFLRLDRSVRYAAAISPPAKSSTSGDWHVEFDTTTTGTDVCTQLRVDGARLQQRTWTASGTNYSQLSNWSTIASNLTNGTANSTSTDRPFSVPDPSTTTSSPFKQLTATIISSSGTSHSATTRSTVTFTALNSSASSTNPVCQQVSVDAAS